jgi:hypothetical protein
MLGTEMLESAARSLRMRMEGLRRIFHLWTQAVRNRKTPVGFRCASLSDTTQARGSRALRTAGGEATPGRTRRTSPKLFRYPARFYWRFASRSWRCRANPRRLTAVLMADLSAPTGKQVVSSGLWRHHCQADAAGALIPIRSNTTRRMLRTGADPLSGIPHASVASDKVRQ